MKKIASYLRTLAALLMAGAAFVSCVDNVIEEPTIIDGTFSMTVTATKEAPTKALTPNGSTLTAEWSVGDHVTVYNVTRSAALEGFLVAKDEGTTTRLQGTLTGTIRSTDELKLMYLSPTFTGQDGTLDYIASHCDYAEATVTVSSVAADRITTTPTATFVNQQAIVKFTLKQKADNSDLVIPAATALTVNDGSTDYTVTPTAATNVLYVAIPATNTVNLSTTVGGINHSYEKTGAGLIAGKYYEITVKMNRAIVNLANITGSTTLLNGDVVTGTLAGNYKISIADGATVTLNGVSINDNGGWTSGDWAGISCEGDATIILSGENILRGIDDDYPGIHIKENKTLTIRGTGSLDASGNPTGNCYSAGIGGDYHNKCGNIVIEGGTITATGGNNGGAAIGGAYCGGYGYITISGGTVTATAVEDGAGIGSGRNSSHTSGNITISGGTVTTTSQGKGAGIGSGYSSNGSVGDILISGGTITATGGNNAAGIGGGYISSCGDITIANTVTRVTATKGSGAPNSIGAGDSGTCGTVKFGSATVYNGSAWSPNPMVAGKYGGMTLAISTTTSTNDTWTLTPPSAPAGVVAVDFGLPSGTLWASCNVGATSPEEFGDYFAWGETAPYYAAGHSNDENCYDWVSNSKEGYNWTSYPYATNNDNTKFNKYTSSENSYATSGTADGLTVLRATDDAATANWGSDWCTPTKEQWQELQNNTTYEWVSSTVIKIYKSSDPSKYILLPTAGFWRNSRYLYQGTLYGFYWTSSLYYEMDDHYPYNITSYDPRHAWFVMFSYSSGISWYGDYPNAHDEDERIYRCNGMPIRPVRAPQN